MNFQPSYMYIGIALLVGLALLYFIFPRPVRREGFQAAAGTPAALVGDAEACRIMKNVLNSINSQLEVAQTTNNPAELTLIKTTKQSMEEQYAALKCT